MADTTETVMQQPPTEFGEYNFPSKDRIELFGDDQLVNVFWEGNVFIVGPGCFRVPRAIAWSDFVSDVVGPWAEADPDYDESKVEQLADRRHSYRPQAHRHPRRNSVSSTKVC